METVYVGLGCNIGDATLSITNAALAIQALPKVTSFNISRYYLTTPVSPIKQGLFVNAVCCFKTEQNMLELFQELHLIEQKMGKGVKRKDAPRIIDLDLLFYGTHQYQGFDINGHELSVPHNEWKNRLFVLLPLLDLTDEISYVSGDTVTTIDLKEYVTHFPNPHRETIILLKENFFRGGDGTLRTS